MTAELYYLTWVSLITALMWVPYILNMIMVRGLVDAVGYPENPEPLAAWASRAKAAHYNAVENLVVFAALVLVVQAMGANSGVTAAACAVYFWARVIHYLVYTFGIPWVRTLAFAVGFVCQVILAVQALS